MNKLTAEIARMDIGHLREHQANPHVGLSLREEKYLQALEIALPVLQQQERGDGEWIEWGGNRAPVDLGATVQVRWKDGDVEKGPCSHFHWGRNCMNPIIAYRVIENDGREG